MSTPTGEGFPDPEDALLALLAGVAPSGTATGPALDEYVQVVRMGGAVDRQGLQDDALVEVATYARTRPRSKELTAAVRSRLSGTRGVGTAAGFVDLIAEVNGPLQVPYANPDERRVTSTWRVVSRLQQLPG